MANLQDNRGKVLEEKIAIDKKNGQYSAVLL
jgi:hypothetical protein